MKELKQGVWMHSRKHPQGFTLDLSTMRQPKRGICVAHRATQNSFSKDDLESVIRHALANDGYVGGWLDEETGQYYFDSVRVFSENKEQQAEQFARENKQLAMFKLSTNQEIKINE